MKLRELFRRRADPVDPALADPPAPAPARAPDWPTMRPIQRTVSAPDLITAPDRFSDSLASWRNPSRSGTLGHYVTPEAPAGVSGGLAMAASRGELPAPARPWWPAPRDLQRHVASPTPTFEPEPAPEDERAPVPPPAPTAVPVYPLTERALVSAAGAEVPSLKLALPAVQRRAAEPEPSPEPASDPELPTRESPPEAPLPPVVPAQTVPPPQAPAASAVSWSARPPELPSARRFGLGAPLQRVPNVQGGPSADGSGPVGMAPPVPKFPPMASVEGPPMSSGTVGAADATPEPEATAARSPSAEPDVPAADRPDPAGHGLPTVQRRVEAAAESVEPPEEAPLVSDATPMSSVAVAPAETPATEFAAGFPSAAGPSPALLQRSVDIPLAPISHLGESRPVEATTPAPRAEATNAAAGVVPSGVQRRVDAERRVDTESDARPVVTSVAAPHALTSSADPVWESGLAGSGLSAMSLQRVADIRPVPASDRVPLPPARPSEQVEAGGDPVTSVEVAPLVSDGRLMTTVTVSRADTSLLPPGPVGSVSGEPSEPASAAAGASPPRHGAEAGVEPVEPTEVAPLVSDVTPMTSVGVPSTETPVSTSGAPSSRADQTTSPAFVQRLADSALPLGLVPVEAPSVVPSAPAAAAAGPSTVEVAPLVSDVMPMMSVTASPPGTSAPVLEPGHPVDRAWSPGFVQRAVDPAEQPGPAAVWPSPPEPIAGTAAPAAAAPSIAQRRVEAGVEPARPTQLAPLVSESAPVELVEPAPAARSIQSVTRSGSAGAVPLLRFVQRAVDTVLNRSPQVWSSPARPTAATPMPAASVPSSAAPSATAPVGLRVESTEAAASTSVGRAVQRVADNVSRTVDLPLAHPDHPEVAVVGHRPLAPAVADHGPDDSAVVEGPVARPYTSGSRSPATTAVQRSVGTGGYPAPTQPLGAPVVRRSPAAVESPDPPSQLIRFVQYVPAVLPAVAPSDPPQQSAELVIQRADADETAATSAPATIDQSAIPGAPAATGAAGAATAGQPAGSTSPTEIDNLVRRLYDPIIRRLKAELQLDRERAGRSLDLWH